MNEWIDVDDRKPEKKKIVLGTDGLKLFIVEYQHSDRWFEGILYGDFGSTFNSDPYPIYSYPKITHWMECPKIPPKKKKYCAVCSKEQLNNGICEKCKDRIRKESLSIVL